MQKCKQRAPLGYSQGGGVRYGEQESQSVAFGGDQAQAAQKLNNGDAALDANANRPGFSGVSVGLDGRGTVNMDNLKEGEYSNPGLPGQYAAKNQDKMEFNVGANQAYAADPKGFAAAYPSQAAGMQSQLTANALARPSSYSQPTAQQTAAFERSLSEGVDTSAGKQTSFGNTGAERLGTAPGSERQTSFNYSNTNVKPSQALPQPPASTPASLPIVPAVSQSAPTSTAANPIAQTTPTQSTAQTTATPKQPVSTFNNVVANPLGGSEYDPVTGEYVSRAVKKQAVPLAQGGLVQGYATGGEVDAATAARHARARAMQQAAAGAQLAEARRPEPEAEISLGSGAGTTYDAGSSVPGGFASDSKQYKDTGHAFAQGGDVSRPRILGKVEGPGTATSDSVPAQLSDGEYVIPANVVRHFGTKHFDNMVKKVTGNVPPPPVIKDGAVHAVKGGDPFYDRENARENDQRHVMQMDKLQDTSAAIQQTQAIDTANKAASVPVSPVMTELSNANVSRMGDATTHTANPKKLDDGLMAGLHNAGQINKNSMVAPAIQQQQRSGDKDFFTGLKPDSMRPPAEQRANGVPLPPAERVAPIASTLTQEQIEARYPQANAQKPLTYGLPPSAGLNDDQRRAVQETLKLQAAQREQQKAQGLGFNGRTANTDTVPTDPTQDAYQQARNDGHGRLVSAGKAALDATGLPLAVDGAVSAVGNSAQIGQQAGSYLFDPSQEYAAAHPEVAKSSAGEGIKQANAATDTRSHPSVKSVNELAQNGRQNLPYSPIDQYSPTENVANQQQAKLGYTSVNGTEFNDKPTGNNFTYDMGANNRQGGQSRDSLSFGREIPQEQLSRIQNIVAEDKRVNSDPVLKAAKEKRWAEIEAKNKFDHLTYEASRGNEGAVKALDQINAQAKLGADERQLAATNEANRLEKQKLENKDVHKEQLANDKSKMWGIYTTEPSPEISADPKALEAFKKKQLLAKQWLIDQGQSAQDVAKYDANQV